MGLSNLKSNFAGKAAAIGLGAVVAMTPMSSAFAEDANANRANVTEIAASRTMDAETLAGRYAERNLGIVVSVNLGTHPSTPSRGRIREALTSDFRAAGINDPITFYFEQNDIPASAASFFYGENSDGPFSLGESRQQAQVTAKTYNFRKGRGLLASASFDR